MVFKWCRWVTAVLGRFCVWLEGWVFRDCIALLIIISMVSMTGTFVKSLSTSSDARIPVLEVDFKVCMNSCIEEIMYLVGIYCFNRSLRASAVSYVTVPTWDIIGRIGGSCWFLCIFGLPYKYPGVKWPILLVMLRLFPTALMVSMIVLSSSLRCLYGLCLFSRIC